MSADTTKQQVNPRRKGKSAGHAAGKFDVSHLVELIEQWQHDTIRLRSAGGRAILAGQRRRGEQRLAVAGAVERCQHELHTAIRFASTPPGTADSVELHASERRQVLQPFKYEQDADV